ncbi:hypothetical protein [Sulfuricurvum sp.]|uniref:hypothetical protein n=1 Tax=Sulfuricurvum sp. TaxID=2025608 RepID=UPI0026115997|nr:hypothetical protein [Sulfuricurvum sp.]MDD2266837.1 hypothetical protein [Sulfuricurvum sp.]MDD2783858.1 hypothetical protein [Sulfuricurvum sp.]
MKPIEKVASDLDIFARDCAVTVALKITDDSCKMDDEQRAVFMALYDALDPYESQIFDESIHTLIREARSTPTAALYAQIKKEREMAMAIITQEKMKSFKSFVRASLLIAELSA